MRRRRTRVLAIASAGGHWVQLMRLSPAWDNLAVSYVSTDPGLRQDLAAEDFRVIVEANRWQKLRLLKQLVQLLLIFITVRQVVVNRLLAASMVTALQACVPGVVVGLAVVLCALPVRILMEPGIASAVAITVAGTLGAAVGLAVSRSARTVFLDVLDKLRGA